jgi:Flp pilus assembly protein protease CpaA
LVNLEIIIINSIFFVAAFVVLIAASIEDYRQRMVSNFWWIILLIIAISKIIAINSYILIYFPGSELPIIPQILGCIIGSAIGLILYLIKLYGGADFKASISISLLIPSILDIYVLNYSELLQIFFFPIISFYLNLGILFLCYSFSIFLYNLISARLRSEKLFEGHNSIGFFRKLLVLSSSIIKPFNSKIKFYYLREIIMDGNLIFHFKFTRKSNKISQISGIDDTNEFSYSLKASNKEEEEKIKNYFEEKNIKRTFIWINPILPLIIFIALDVVILLLFGDIILTISHLF